MYGDEAQSFWDRAPNTTDKRYDHGEGPFTFAEFKDVYEDGSVHAWAYGTKEPNGEPEKRYDGGEGPFSIAEYEEAYGEEAIEHWLHGTLKP